MKLNRKTVFLLSIFSSYICILTYHFVIVEHTKASYTYSASVDVKVESKVWELNEPTPTIKIDEKPQEQDQTEETEEVVENEDKTDNKQGEEEQRNEGNEALTDSSVQNDSDSVNPADSAEEEKEDIQDVPTTTIDENNKEQPIEEEADHEKNH